MPSRTLPILPLVLVALACGGAPLAHAASAEPVAIESADRAKLARVKARGNAAARAFVQGKKGTGDGFDDCSIDIGNVDTDGRGRGPREVNIFIPGDIFQIDNRCR